MPADAYTFCVFVCEVRMSLRILSLRFLKGNFALSQFSPAVLIAIALLLGVVASALAHHPFDGKAPDTLVEAFLSGLGHPVIGVDHLAFVIAADLLAAALGGGWWMPLAIAATAWWTGKTMLEKLLEPSRLALRFAGFVICGVGATCLLTLLVDSIFPA